MKKFLLLLLSLLIVCSSGFAEDAVPHMNGTVRISISGISPDEARLIAGRYIMDKDGDVQLAYIYKVHVLETAASVIKAKIESAFIDGGYFIHPIVDVTVDNRQFVRVTGEVMNKEDEGFIEYKAGMTVMDAIKAAGGFTAYADPPTKVRLMHSGKFLKEINCKKIQKNPGLDFQISPSDEILVPQGWKAGM